MLSNQVQLIRIRISVCRLSSATYTAFHLSKLAALFTFTLTLRTQLSILILISMNQCARDAHRFALVTRLVAHSFTLFFFFHRRASGGAACSVIFSLARGSNQAFTEMLHPRARCASEPSELKLGIGNPCDSVTVTVTVPLHSVFSFSCLTFGSFGNHSFTRRIRILFQIRLASRFGQVRDQNLSELLWEAFSSQSSSGSAHFGGHAFRGTVQSVYSIRTVFETHSFRVFPAKVDTFCALNFFLDESFSYPQFSLVKCEEVVYLLARFPLGFI